MGSPFSFECRRRELEILGEPFDDESVVNSYLNLILPGGELFEYICNGNMAVIIEDTLFVHGGLTEEFIGFVPPKRGQESVHYSEVHEWVKAINAYAKDELESYRFGIYDYLNSLNSLENPAQESWDFVSGYDHPQPGSRLIQCGMGSSGRDNKKHPTVIYTSYLNRGSPVWPSNRASDWLSSAGVTKLLVGHQPMGDSPLLLSAPNGLTAVCADVCYSKGVQYRLSDLRKSVHGPRHTAFHKEITESEDSQELYVPYSHYAIENGISKAPSPDPWVAADTRAPLNFSEVCLISDQDTPLRVCSFQNSFDLPPVTTTICVNGVLSQGSEFQYTYPEPIEDSLIGKKTPDNWIVKARGIYLPKVDEEYVQLGKSQGLDFKARLVPVTEVRRMTLLSSWESK
jgi:hypothetical protein